jgi:dipeptidase E
MGQIVAIGGFETPEESFPLFRFVVELAGKQRPRLLLVPTAMGDQPEPIEGFVQLASPFAEVSVLNTFPWPPSDLRELVLAQDVIFVEGGNTANMLAIWRVHGVDQLMREAWQRGVLLVGVSAGTICRFESGVTDSFGPQLDSLQCLGFLAGSACPHYDREEARRPRYRELVANGMPGGLAIDDCVGLHFVDRELRGVVSTRAGATAYRVTQAGEEPLDATLIT